MTARHILAIAALAPFAACNGDAETGAEMASIHTDGPVEGTYLERLGAGNLPGPSSVEEIEDANDQIAALLPGGLPGDRDGDGLEDFIDTCPSTPDSSNVDVDGDGFGNACDADYNQDGVVTILDFSVFLAAFGSMRGDDDFDSRADHNSDGVVTTADYGTFLEGLNSFMSAETPGTIAFEDAQPGDSLSLVYRYGDDISNQVHVLTIDGVVRGDDGEIEELSVGAGRVVILVNGLIMVEDLLVVLLDPGPPTIGVSCPRAVVFPERSIGSLSQLCTGLPIDGLSINISRP